MSRHTRPLKRAWWYWDRYPSARPLPGPNVRTHAVQLFLPRRGLWVNNSPPLSRLDAERELRVQRRARPDHPGWVRSARVAA